MKFLIYRHVNVLNGKSYIGMTSLTMKLRWKKHLQKANEYSKYAFHYALRKYGSLCWKHEILEENVSDIEACKRAEIFWIAKFNSKNQGYNRTLGGDGTWGCIHRPLSLEARQKISARNKGKKHTEETKRRIGVASSHRKISIETKKKNAEAAKRENLSPETLQKRSKALSKPTFKFTLEGEMLQAFPSLKLAALNSGGSSSSKLCVAIKRQIPYRGFFWAYEEIINKISQHPELMEERDRIKLEEHELSVKETIVAPKE